MRNAHLHLKLVAHTLRGATAALPILLLSGRQTLFVSRPNRSARSPALPAIESGLVHCIWLRMLALLLLLLLLPLLCLQLQWMQFWYKNVCGNCSQVKALLTSLPAQYPILSRESEVSFSSSCGLQILKDIASVKIKQKLRRKIIKTYKPCPA